MWEGSISAWIALGGVSGALMALLGFIGFHLRAVKHVREESARQHATAVTYYEREIERLTQEAQTWRDESTQHLQRANGLDLQLVELRAILEQERQARAAQQELLDTAEDRWKTAFQALSAEALQTNSQRFLELAGENLSKYREQARGDLDQRKEAVAQLVQPLRERLGEMQQSVQAMERKREGAYQGLTEQVRQLLETGHQLQRETAQLIQALRQPQVRGRWGEMQLRRTVELAGMQERCDFAEQAAYTTEEQRLLRPDMVMHLPNGRDVIVDAKAPLAAYLDALEAAPSEQAAHLQRHAQQLREHIKLLSRKAYWKQFERTPDFVVLFVPGEVFFSAALQADGSLLDFAAEHHIVLATPTTLISLLKTVAYGWREIAIEHDAREIVALGLELQERLSKVFGDHLDKVRRGLEGAVNAYNATVSSLEARVLPSVRKLEQLESLATKPLPDPQPAAELPRNPTAPELLTEDPEKETEKETEES